MTDPRWQQQGQQPSPWVDPNTGWWWDGHKWRPPVPQLTRGQLIQQVPGALIKLIFLVGLLVLLIVFLASAL